MDTERNRPNAAIISIIVIALIAVAAGAVYAANANKRDSEQSSVSNTQQPASDANSSTTAQTTSSTTSSTFKNGSYTATGNYTTPGGGESITITVTLSGNTISDINATGSASRGDSAQYQSKFLSGYKAQVVGKPIDSVSLSRVSGSSLTSNGFNAAIKKIKDEAVS